MSEVVTETKVTKPNPVLVKAIRKLLKKKDVRDLGGSLYRTEGWKDLPKTGEGMYPFVPMNKEAIKRMLIDADKEFQARNCRKPETFLDIGCGIGNVLQVAQTRGLKISGLEYNPVYVQIARKIFPRANIIEANMLEWLPPKGTTYDIIYSWIPLADHKLWKEFSERFVEKFPNGQLFIAPSSLDTRRFIEITPNHGVCFINRNS